MFLYLLLLFLLLGLTSLKLCFRPKRWSFRKTDVSNLKVSLIIPARNEAKNLPTLFGSLKRQSLTFHEVIVANDSSTDQTEELALGFGAKVIKVPPLAEAWTGKTWALQNAAKTATGELLFFLDADAFFETEALAEILQIFGEATKPTALSIIPYHRIGSFCENFSLYFNVLMVMGTDSFLLGFSQKQSRARLVGQSLLIPKALFLQLGGYESVKSEILENFFLSSHLQANGIACRSILGKNLLSFRMFSEGLGQLYSGWRKAFSKGAKSVSSSTLFLSVLWLFASQFLALALPLSFIFGFEWRFALLAYLAIAWNLFLVSRKVGNYSFAFSLFYPVPLAFYFWVYFSSIWNLGPRAEWKGRKV